MQVLVKVAAEVNFSTADEKMRAFLTDDVVGNIQQEEFTPSISDSAEKQQQNERKSEHGRKGMITQHPATFVFQFINRFVSFSRTKWLNDWFKEPDSSFFFLYFIHRLPSSTLSGQV